MHRINCFLQDDEEESRTHTREAPTRKLRDEPPKYSYGGKRSLDDLKSSVSHHLCWRSRSIIRIDSYVFPTGVSRMLPRG